MRFYYLFLLLAVSGSGIFGNGGKAPREILQGLCYQFDFPNNFKPSEFVKSRWFEIGRYDNEFEGDSQCVYVTSKINVEADTWTIYFNLPEPDGSLTTIVGNVRPSNGSDGYEAHFPDDSAWSSFNIIDIDYDNYCIIYSCWQKPVDDGSLPEKQERLWILGRNRQLTPEIEQKINQTLHHDGDNLGRFVSAINQTCT